MLMLFERVIDDISNITKKCGCSNSIDHFKIKFSDNIICTDRTSRCDQILYSGRTNTYIKCMPKNRLIITHHETVIPQLSIHTKCNIDVINDAYQQLVYDETKELYNKIRLVYVSFEFYDIIRYTMLILIPYGFRYLK
jgi:hypothetical protein